MQFFTFKFIGWSCVAVALVIASVGMYRSLSRSQIPVVFSQKTMLTALWEEYKKHYWEADTGRTIDRQRNNVTTSEGQSYTLLRAVWQDDQPTFDKTWKWTKDISQRSDHL